MAIQPSHLWLTTHGRGRERRSAVVGGCLQLLRPGGVSRSGGGRARGNGHAGGTASGQQHRLPAGCLSIRSVSRKARGLHPRAALAYVIADADAAGYEAIDFTVALDASPRPAASTVSGSTPLALSSAPGDRDQIRAWKVSGDGGPLASRQAVVPTGRVYPYNFLLVRGAAVPGGCRNILPSPHPAARARPRSRGAAEPAVCAIGKTPPLNSGRDALVSATEVH
ncbi:hypothetical protein BH23GEM9_BH23GEM9_23490 [soil metagenome]